MAGKNPVCDCVGGSKQKPPAEARASDRRLTRMISPDTRGVTAMMHVAIKMCITRRIRPNENEMSCGERESALPVEQES